ncbi:MAG: glycosyltransferase family 4 protein [Bernardetiaceae bacterium]
MKVLIISPWFSEKMGYAENHLPVAFGKSGIEVHLLTSDLQVYATSPDYDKIYRSYLGPKQVDQGTFIRDGYTLHRHGHRITSKGEVEILAIEEKIKTIRPNLVYTFDILLPETIVAANLKKRYGYQLFTESRLHKSVFTPPKSKIKFWKQYLHGYRLSKKINVFYPVAPDVQEVITKYFGVPSTKCTLSSLAVATDIFKVPEGSMVSASREQLGFKADEIVCIYTGRFTDTKSPITLARAIDHLQEQGYEQFKGVFVGAGDPSYVQQIREQRGCHVHDFVPSDQLPLWYGMSDIGVWPKEESNSQLDALACGLPIVISDRVEDVFRTEGCGLSYHQEDPIHLAHQLLALKDPQKRRQMSKVGSQKIKQYYSWDVIAKERLETYQKNKQKKHRS